MVQFLPTQDIKVCKSKQSSEVFAIHGTLTLELPRYEMVMNPMGPYLILKAKGRENTKH